MKLKKIARCSLKFSSLTLVAWTLSIYPAVAWNSIGHRTVAELAWRQLDDNERQAVSDLLKQHPHYQQLLAANVPNGVETNEWVFLNSAVWPDWVRPAKEGQSPKPVSITKYDLYPHAVGYPFMLPSETNHAFIENFSIAKPNAEMVLANSIATLKNPKASAHDRAVSLCWTLHLFGDLHQPLHAANLVTKKRPHGDRLGGNHIAVDTTRGKQINFHSFWDQLPGLDPSYDAIAALADKLVKDPKLKSGALPEYRDNKSIGAWVQESFRTAVNFAYAENRVQFVHSDDVKLKKIPDSKIPKLSKDFVDQARTIAQRRLALAGLRLTDELKPIF